LYAIAATSVPSHKQSNIEKRCPSNHMNNSNSTSDPTSTRVTLKLKPGVRMTPREIKSPQMPGPRSTGKLKPGAHWSDESKERMQADMNALISR
jgi:hypothetical protein